MRHIPKLCGPRADGRFYVRDPDTDQRTYFGRDRAAAEAAYEGWRLAFLSRVPGVVPGARLTVADLAARYLEHAEGYYRKGGRPTSEANGIKAALDCLAGYRDLWADEFGTAELKGARLRMIERGWSRQYINAGVRRLWRCWRWAVAEELLPVERLTLLKTLAPLAKGRTAAHEQRKIQAVPVAVVEATLPFFRPRRWRALVLVHLASGMRAEEAVALRGCDLDTTGTPWVYRVGEEANKLAHQDRERRVPIGPRGRQALGELLAEARSGRDWLFPSRVPGVEHVTVDAYHQAVNNALRRANLARARADQEALPHWTPLMVRHRALTDVRARYGLEGAAAIGGHTELRTTVRYAETSWELACEVAEAMG